MTIINNSRPIIAINSKNGEKREFESMAQAARKLFIRTPSIIYKHINKSGLKNGNRLKGVKSYKTGERWFCEYKIITK